MMRTSDELRLTILGCRGSFPVLGKDVQEFGGNTSCYLLQAQGESLFLDAGTGLLRAALPESGPVRILFTHAHLDHVLGLLLFPALLDPSREVILCGGGTGGDSLEEALSRLVCPPLWPLPLADYPARVTFRSLSFPLAAGPFTVTGMQASHPGGSAVFRIDACGKSVVLATDFEHTEEKIRELAAFAAGADLLLYDSQYTPEEYEARRGFGHSTAQTGLRVLRESGAKRLLPVHHDPAHTDAFLREQEAALVVPFAREGEVICL